MYRPLPCRTNGRLVVACVGMARIFFFFGQLQEGQVPLARRTPERQQPRRRPRRAHPRLLAQAKGAPGVLTQKSRPAAFAPPCARPRAEQGPRARCPDGFSARLVERRSMAAAGASPIQKEILARSHAGRKKRTQIKEWIIVGPSLHGYTFVTAATPCRRGSWSIASLYIK